MKNKTMYPEINPNHSSYPFEIKMIELELSNHLKDLHSTFYSLDELKTSLQKIEKEVNSLDDVKDYEHVKDKLLDSIPSVFEIHTLINEHIKFKLKLLDLIKRYYPDSSLVHNISPRKLTKVLDEFQVTSLDRNPIN